MNFKVLCNPFYDYDQRLFLQQSCASNIKIPCSTEINSWVFPHTKKAMISFKISDYFMEMKEQPNLPSSVKKIVISL